MDFVEKIFLRYFNDQITGEELLRIVGSDKGYFEIEWKRELEKTIYTEDGKALGCLLNLLTISAKEIPLQHYVNMLLLLEAYNWHRQHKMIEILLDKCKNM